MMLTSLLLVRWVADNIQHDPDWSVALQPDAQQTAMHSILTAFYHNQHFFPSPIMTSINSNFRYRNSSVELDHMGQPLHVHE